MAETVKRHELWRKQYEEDRYMSGLSEVELDERFADILTNQTTLTADGKLGIGNIEWTEKWIHVVLELQSRGLGVPTFETIEHRTKIPDPTSVDLGTRVRDSYPSGIPESFTLFKYGKSKHLRPLLDRGELLMRPASSYDDSSLNLAISDRELVFEKVNHDERVRYTSRFDFYIFCSSWLHSDRLISDFCGDSVLVIEQPHEFFVRLATALDEKAFSVDFDRVTYIDPLLLRDHHVNHIAYAKHMRFAYQFEHRFVAMPPKEIVLSERKLNLGPIRDIATLYEAH